MFAPSTQAALMRCAAAATEPAAYRGLRRVAWALGRIFPEDNKIVVTRAEGKLWLYLNDGYWSPLLRKSWAYEPEVGHALGRLLSPDGYFVDGGANIGYWSMYASARLPPDGVIAIEAAPRSYRRLAENAGLNDNRWQCIQAALWNVSEETLTMHASKRFHASGTVIARLSMPDSGITEVQTITVDDIVRRHASDPNREVVIKLDVEGAEVEAIDGAAQTLKDRAWHLIYEDHGKDPTHAVTRRLMEDLGLRVHAIADAGVFVPVTRLEMLDRIKRDIRRGYNFVASADDVVGRLART